MTTSSPETLPAGGPADRAAVKGLLGITDTTDDDRLDLLADAVNDVVAGLPGAQRARGADTWPAGLTLGANMLTARLHQRGQSTFGSAALPGIADTDPDSALLLGVGSWAKPAVG